MTMPAPEQIYDQSVGALFEEKEKESESMK